MTTRRAFRLVIGLATVLTVAMPTHARAEEAPPSAPSPHAVEAMRLLDSKDAYQRELGFLRLEALREPGTVSVIQRYVQDRDPDTRAYSLRALAAIQGTEAIPVLLQALRQDREARVRRAAILGLEPFERANAEVLPALIKALRDKNVEVRITAVDVVSRIDDPKAKEAILVRHKRERSSDVRRVLVSAMKRLGQRS